MKFDVTGFDLYKALNDYGYSYAVTALTDLRETVNRLLANRSPFPV